MRLIGEGSIVPQDGKDRYKCRKWRLYQSTDDGRKSKRVSGTLKQAKSALADFRAELASEGGEPGTVPTFSEYAGEWYEMRKRMQLSGGTLENNMRDIKTLMPPFGKKAMTDISPKDVLGFKASMLDGTLKGHKLSGTYSDQIFGTLNMIMKQAVADEVIPSNPCDKVTRPKHDTKERKAMTAAQMDRCFELMTAVLDDGFKVAAAMQLDCGLRGQEALALEPHDVDTGNGTVRIDHAIKECDNSRGGTKSRASERVLPMTERLRDVCRRWNVVRREYGIEDAPYCCQLDGRRFTLDTYRVWWRSHAVEWGVEGFTPHQMRHSYMTRMAPYVTSPFTLQHLAGWSTLAQASTYVHKTFDDMAEAVNAAQAGAPPVKTDKKNAPHVRHIQRKARGAGL